jgi:multiple sugar transport system ATP-binding protein
VTHDQVEAMTLADRILLLNSGAAVAKHGSVAQCGAPLDLYHHPRNRFVAGFIGSPTMNFLPGTLVSATPGLATVRLDGGEQFTAAVDARRLVPGARCTLGIRPEHAEPGTSGQHLVRDLLWLERLGEATYLYLDSGTPGTPWVVKAPGATSARPGQRVPLHLPAGSMHLFDVDDQALPRCSDTTDLPLPAVA